MKWIQIFKDADLTGYASQNGKQLRVVRSNGQSLVGKPKKIQMPPKDHKDYFFLKTCLTIGYVSSLGKGSESIFLTEEENTKWQYFLDKEQSTSPDLDKIKKSLHENNKMLALLQAQSLQKINARSKRDRIIRYLNLDISNQPSALWCELIALEIDLSSVNPLDTAELVHVLQSVEEAINIGASFSISLQVNGKTWTLYFLCGKVVWATGLNADIWHRLAREQANKLDDPTSFWGFNAALPMLVEDELSDADLDLLFAKTLGIEQVVEELLGSAVINILVDIIQSARIAKKTKGSSIFYGTKKIYSSSATIGKDYAPLLELALAQWVEWMDYVSKNFDSPIDASRIHGLAKLEDGSESISSLAADGEEANLAMTVMELIKIGAVWISSERLLSSTTIMNGAKTSQTNNQTKVCVIHRSAEVFDYYQNLLLELG
jgi:hypothetical protein